MNSGQAGVLANFLSVNPQDGDTIYYNSATGNYENSPSAVVPGTVFTSAPATGDGSGLSPVTLVDSGVVQGNHPYPSNVETNSKGLIVSITDGNQPLLDPLLVGASIDGDGQSTNLDVAEQPNPAAPITAAVGLQHWINTRGITDNFCSLDNSNFGQASPGTTAYVGVFEQEQDINHNSETTILLDTLFDAQYWNSLPSWCNTGTGVWTVPTTGWYELKCHGRFPGAGGNQRRISLRATTSNPSATNFVLKEARYLDAGAVPSLFTLDNQMLYRFTAGDTFWFTAFQDSGVTISSCLFIQSVHFVSNSYP